MVLGDVLIHETLPHQEKYSEVYLLTEILPSKAGSCDNSQTNKSILPVNSSRDAKVLEIA